MLFESDDFSGTTNSIELIGKCDTIFTFVDTVPTLDGGNDTTNVFEVTNHFFTASQLDKPIHNKKFIIGSTMNPGDTEQIQEKLHMFNIQVGYCPSMSSEGNIINGYYNSDVVIVGTEYQELSTQLMNIFSRIQPNGVNLCSMSSKSAEIAKLSINTFSSMKISFVNMLGDLFIKSGLENERSLILNSVGKDSRVGVNSLKYGFGYGGINLPRDVKTLTDYLTKYDIDTTLITSVKDSNENHLKFLKEYYISQNPDKTNPFVFNYLWYKKDSDSLVDSQPYKLCIELLEEGYHVNVIDDLSLGQKLNEISQSYEGKLKFFKKGTTPNGYLIKL